MRLIDDRSSDDRSEYAWVCDCERSTSHVVWHELLVTSAVREIVKGSSDANEVLLFSLFNDRNDKPSISEGNGTAEVDVLFENDLLSFKRAVHVRESFQRFDRCFKEEWSEAQAKTLALLEGGFVLRAIVRDSGAIYLLH